MARLLHSWMLLAAIWGAGQLLLNLLALRAVELTASALWTTALVSACQALALESLAAPFGFARFLTQAAGSLRRPAVRLLWLLAAAAVATAHLFAPSGAALLASLAALLAVLAAGLFAFVAWRPGGLLPARPALRALALLVLLAPLARARPWLTLLPAWLLPHWPQGPARSLFAALFVAALYSALFRLQRRLSGLCDTASGWLAAAAGVGALGLAAILLPLRLMDSIREVPPLGAGMLLVLVSACLATAGLCLLPEYEKRESDDSRALGPRRQVSPALGPVLLISALAAIVGLVLAHTLLTLPVELTARGVLVLALVVAGQALAWSWLRRRERPLAAAAWRHVAAHAGLALWTGAEWVGLTVLWVQRTAGWSRVASVWELVAIYSGVRAALLALTVVGLLLRQRRSAPPAGAPSSAAGEPFPAVAVRAPPRLRPVLRGMFLAAALAAPALLPLLGSRAAWQTSVAAGLLTLIGLTVCAPAGPARDTWVGLALVVAWPAAALAIATFVAGEVGLPLTSPIALSCLLPSLGLANLAASALFSGPRDGGP